MRAADNADATLIKLLLDSGARKDAKDRAGRTAAMWAKQRDDEAGRVAAKLLE
jgi:ankyrin repeat protein